MKGNGERLFQRLQELGGPQLPLLNGTDVVEAPCRAEIVGVGMAVVAIDNADGMADSAVRLQDARAVDAVMEQRTDEDRQKIQQYPFRDTAVCNIDLRF